ncbi:MAG: caspase family protein [Candidatus Riflebacteria bacterium]|nr:caspase family protein [Candidatus Riflebacteria bacterium]
MRTRWASFWWRAALTSVLLASLGSRLFGASNRALLIGISRYEDPRLRLQYAHRDAQELGKVLERSGYETSVLVDEQATRAQIYLAVAALRGRCQPDDTVLFFFSGHGMACPGGKLVLLPADAKQGVPDGGGLAVTDVMSLVCAMPGKVKLGFIDACHAGNSANPRELLEVLQNLGGARFAEGAIDAPESSSLCLAMSCQSREVSYEHQRLQMGVFTSCLIEALRGRGEWFPEKALTFDRVFDYLAEEVPRRAHELISAECSQTPRKLVSASKDPVVITLVAEDTDRLAAVWDSARGVLRQLGLLETGKEGTPGAVRDLLRKHPWTRPMLDSARRFANEQWTSKQAGRLSVQGSKVSSAVASDATGSTAKSLPASKLSSSSPSSTGR